MSDLSIRVIRILNIWKLVFLLKVDAISRALYIKKAGEYSYFQYDFIDPFYGISVYPHKDADNHSSPTDIKTDDCAY